MVAIIDDREDVWNYLPNVIHVKPYLFFVGTADINAPPNLKKDEPAGQKRKSTIVKVPKKRGDQNAHSIKQSKSESNSDSDKEMPMDEDISEKKETNKSDNESMEAADTNKLESGKSEIDERTRDSKEETNKENRDENVEKADIEVDGSIDTEQRAEGTDDNPKGTEECKDNEKLKDGEIKKTSSDESSKEESNMSSKDDTTETKEVNEDEYDELIEWEDEDDYLLYLEDILHKVHTAFYELYDQMKTTDKQTVPNVKKIIPYVRRKVLKGTNIVFSGVFPMNTPPEKSRAYVIAQALGANVQTQFIAREEDNQIRATTHVVAAKLGTIKVNTALKHKGVHVVTPEWLWTCNDRWERVDERLFYVNEKNSRYNVRDSPDVIKMKRRKRKRTNMEISQRDSKKVKPDSTEKLESTIEGIQDNEEADQDDKDDETVNDANGEDDNDKDDEMQGDEEKPSTSTGAKRRVERQFSDTLNPLISFSKDDIDNMDKEVEDLLDKSDSDDSETKEEETLRKKILGKGVEESSSEDSLSGDFPRGWNIKRKHPRKKLPSDEGEEEEDDQMEGIIDGAVDQPHRVFKHSDQSSSSENSDFNESVGSVDEEMAEAIEREFLNY